MSLTREEAQTAVEQLNKALGDKSRIKFSLKGENNSFFLESTPVHIMMEEDVLNNLRSALGENIVRKNIESVEKGGRMGTVDVSWKIDNAALITALANGKTKELETQLKLEEIENRERQARIDAEAQAKKNAQINPRDTALKLDVLSGNHQWSADHNGTIFTEDKTLTSTFNKQSSIQVGAIVLKGCAYKAPYTISIGKVEHPMDANLSLTDANIKTINQAPLSVKQCSDYLAKYFLGDGRGGDSSKPATNVKVLKDERNRDVNMWDKIMNLLKDDVDKLKFLQATYENIIKNSSQLYTNSQAIKRTYTNTQIRHIEDLQREYQKIVNKHSNDPVFLQALSKDNVTNGSHVPYSKECLINFNPTKLGRMFDSTTPVKSSVINTIESGLKAAPQLRQ